MWIYRRNPDAPEKPQSQFPDDKDTGLNLWQVGYFVGADFHIMRLQTSERDAARVVHYLNGGAPTEWPPTSQP